MNLVTDLLFATRNEAPGDENRPQRQYGDVDNEQPASRGGPYVEICIYVWKGGFQGPTR